MTEVSRQSYRKCALAELNGTVRKTTCPESETGSRRGSFMFSRRASINSFACPVTLFEKRTTLMTAERPGPNAGERSLPVAIKVAIFPRMALLVPGHRIVGIIGGTKQRICNA